MGNSSGKEAIAGAGGDLYDLWLQLQVRIVEKKDTKRLYALKYINKLQCIKMRAIQNIFRERALLEELHHPLIVNLQFAFQDDVNLFMVIDLMLGGDLRYHLDRQPGAFQEDTVRVWCAELASAITFLHRNKVAHRDLKPDNILLDESGHAHITDFNVAVKFENRDHLSSHSGTLSYMAPEIFGDKGYFWPVDWWSLGVTIYELIWGARPFRGDSNDKIKRAIVEDELVFHRTTLTPKAFPMSISPEGLNFISGLLVKDPNGRLGCGTSGSQAIFSHPWLAGFDLNDIEGKKLKPTFLPDSDRSNFDATYDLEELLLDDNPLSYRPRRRTKKKGAPAPEFPPSYYLTSAQAAQAAADPVSAVLRVRNGSSGGDSVGQRVPPPLQASMSEPSLPSQRHPGFAPAPPPLASMDGGVGNFGEVSVDPSMLQYLPPPPRTQITQMSMQHGMLGGGGGGSQPQLLGQGGGGFQAFQQQQQQQPQAMPAMQVGPPNMTADQELQVLLQFIDDFFRPYDATLFDLLKRADTNSPAEPPRSGQQQQQQQQQQPQPQQQQQFQQQGFSMQPGAGMQQQAQQQQQQQPQQQPPFKPQQQQQQGSLPMHLNGPQMNPPLMQPVPRHAAAGAATAGSGLHSHTHSPLPASLAGPSQAGILPVAPEPAARMFPPGARLPPPAGAPTPPPQMRFQQTPGGAGGAVAAASGGGGAWAPGTPPQMQFLQQAAAQQQQQGGGGNGMGYPFPQQQQQFQQQGFSMQPGA
ncbi:hypothetical protein HK405_009928, partial [Cladochytrium tenue]